ncbi:TPA: calcium/sodium antiporter [Candidatus Woesearchaeota archaeon]|nr:calcium/sodium antiporter [Candidatus Woesearchaeota archaeon]
MFINILLLLIGLVLLVKGSDVFVERASRIAKALGISEFVIGLTLVAVGTSIPEMASSVIASIKNEPAIIIGNIVGSNIANIGLIVGLSATIAVITTHVDMLKRDGYIMLFISLLAAIFALLGIISFWAGLFFIFLYLAYVMFLIESKDARQEYHFREFIIYFFRLQHIITLKDAMVKNIRRGQKRQKMLSLERELLIDVLFIIISGAAIILGAKFLVEQSVWLAEAAHISKHVIGLSLVAIGTSLPELAVSIAAARKKFGDMLLGNIIGSNIANNALIMGMSAMIRPIIVPLSEIYSLFLVMIAFSFLLLYFIKKGWKITRAEGAILLGLYSIYIIAMFVIG